jgi:hypothetical protein
VPAGVTDRVRKPDRVAGAEASDSTPVGGTEGQEGAPVVPRGNNDESSH